METNIAELKERKELMTIINQVIVINIYTYAIHLQTIRFSAIH